MFSINQIKQETKINQKHNMEASKVINRIETEGFVSATVSIYDEMLELEKTKEAARKVFIQAEADYQQKKAGLDTIFDYANDKGFIDKTSAHPVVRVPYKENLVEIRRYSSNDGAFATVVKFTIPPFNPLKYA